MSFWRRLLGSEPASGQDGDQTPPQQAAPTPATPADEPAPIAVPATPADCLALLRRYADHPRESEALTVLLRKLAEADSSFDEVRVPCARLLEERGRASDALDVLETVRSVDAMMLAADLHSATGQLARALATVERVMVRAIDTPGARERHERWSKALGRSDSDRVYDANDATVVAPAAQRTSFRLLREVARGGAGTIYEAEDDQLGRRVAYKIYHRGAEDAEQITREARMAVRVRGPGVLRIYDADPQQGWLATEWVVGGNLRDRLARRERLSPLDGWVPALIRGLARVHAAGLVHGDLKPANVLFRSDTDPVLADFGLCRAIASKAVGGTPGYLSPERLAGDVTDPRDDVYALGRILEDVVAATDDDDRAALYARTAIVCLRAATERPRNADAVLSLL